LLAAEKQQRRGITSSEGDRCAQRLVISSHVGLSGEEQLERRCKNAVL
jgi:hypothetical protein